MEVVGETYKHFLKLNILVNHAGEQYPHKDIEEMDLEMMEKTYPKKNFIT